MTSQNDVKAKRSLRTKYVLGIATDVKFIDKIGLVNALCQCLSEDESCILLQESIAVAPNLRSPLLRKLCEDIDRSFRPSHTILISELLTSLESSDARLRQSAGYCIASLLPHLPADNQGIVISAFLRSRFIGIRRRAYKWLEKNTEIFENEIIEAWEKFKDVECAWLIVKTFPMDFVIENRACLQKSLTERWQISRLYLRIGEYRPKLLPELEARDPISYCYILAKLDLPLSIKKAKSYIDACASDTRFGLLVWSLGRLRLWSALRYVHEKLPTIQEQKLASFRTSVESAKQGSEAGKL